MASKRQQTLFSVLLRLWPLLIALLITLFPFDWLSQAWPLFGEVFDRVFVTARDHHIGHSTLFFLVGLLTLLCLPMLRRHPLPYLGLLVLVAIGQEALQSLFNQRLPNLGDGLDLFFDLLGWVIAYMAIWLWQWARYWRRSLLLRR
ncbi:MAG: hypothetical protein JOZ18_05320 [Chloroflexi bacterium]|nr:hypothetical protein [Chloroflexota bacterium]